MNLNNLLGSNPMNTKTPTHDTFSRTGTEVLSAALESSSLVVMDSMGDLWPPSPQARSLSTEGSCFILGGTGMSYEIGMELHTLFPGYRSRIHLRTEVPDCKPKAAGTSSRAHQQKAVAIRTAALSTIPSLRRRNAKRFR
jgi:hypothetical protein